MELSDSLLLEIEAANTLQILFEVYRPLFVLTHNYPQALQYLSHRSCQMDGVGSSVHSYSSFPFELTECLKEEREYLLDSYYSQANALAVVSSSSSRRRSGCGSSRYHREKTLPR